MSVRKCFVVFLLIICSTVSMFAQSDNEVVEFNQNNSKTLDLIFFLPIKTESWIISLTASGGIMGGTRLLVALNSNGNVMCAPNETTYQNRFAPKADFENISQLVSSEIPTLNFNPNKKASKDFGFCNDCSFETLTINYRGEKSILTEKFAVGDFNSSKSKLKEIYQIVNELRVCN